VGKKRKRKGKWRRMGIMREKKDKRNNMGNICRCICGLP
jgi:hypothetical protein